MIYFITGNPGKFAEISAVLPGIDQLELDLLEIQSLDPRVVIEHKLTEAAKLHDAEFIVEDTSLELACLGGLPGTFVRWFEKAIGVDGIAALALKHEDRSVIARVTIGYRDAAGHSHFFEGINAGDIVAPRGSHGFGWSPIFQPRGENRTFGEMLPEEKNAMSMRGIAARKLKAHLEAQS